VFSGGVIELNSFMVGVISRSECCVTKVGKFCKIELSFPEAVNLS
jgi:hypothetical protein